MLGGASVSLIIWDPHVNPGKLFSTPDHALSIWSILGLVLLSNPDHSVSCSLTFSNPGGLGDKACYRIFRQRELPGCRLVDPC